MTSYPVRAADYRVHAIKLTAFQFMQL
jgi:hypothetical protein